MEDLGWKLASAGVMAVSALAAGKIVEVAWKAATGRDVPREDDDEAALISLIVFAAASAAIGAVAERYAFRAAKKMNSRRLRESRNWE